MYSGWQRGKAPSSEWTEQTIEFLDHAFSLLGVVENETIKCPYAMCQNYFKHKRHTIELHLCQYGFKEGYEIWTEHGETHVSHDDYCPTTNNEGFNEVHSPAANNEGLNEVDHVGDMLQDLVAGQPPSLDGEPTSSTQAFYRMVAGAYETVHERTTHSSLSAIARLLALKSMYNMSIGQYNDVVNIIHELLPPDSKLPRDFYQSKKC
jgi:hypothetical protein